MPLEFTMHLSRFNLIVHRAQSPRTSFEGEEIENVGENYNYRNIKNGNLPFDDRELIMQQDSKLTHCLGECFTYSRLADVGQSSPSRVTNSLFGSLKKIVKFCSFKCYSRRSVLLLCYDKTFTRRDTR